MAKQKIVMTITDDQDNGFTVELKLSPPLPNPPKTGSQKAAMKVCNALYRLGEVVEVNNKAV